MKAKTYYYDESMPITSNSGKLLSANYIKPIINIEQFCQYTLPMVFTPNDRLFLNKSGFCKW